jgi:Tetratricopeptide repeat
MASVRFGCRPAWWARFAPVALVILVAAAPASRAQQGPDSDQRRRKASDHVKKGDAYKDAGNYEAAAREYEKAYEQVPHPVLFFNLGQVHRLNGDEKVAVEYYERYLVAEPNGRASKQARYYATQLRRQIRRQQARAGGGGEGSGTGSGAGAGSGLDAEVEAEASAGEAGRGLRIAGLVSAGAGLVAVGFGVKFGLDARSIGDEINSHDQGQWPDELLAKQADGERAERNMLILTGAGAAAIAAGGVLYYLGHRSRRQAADRTTAVIPVAGSDGFGLVVSGGF